MNNREASRWMKYAETDLQAAQALLDSGEFFPHQVCFLAQQAGEKALKAILVYLEIKFPLTHDLDHLRELIPTGWKIKETYPHLYALSVWAVEARYPGDTQEITNQEERDALRLAESLVNAVKEELQGKRR